jgi:hypothetical protein
MKSKLYTISTRKKECTCMHVLFLLITINLDMASVATQAFIFLQHLSSIKSFLRTREYHRINCQVM